MIQDGYRTMDEIRQWCNPFLCATSPQHLEFIKRYEESTSNCLRFCTGSGIMKWIRMMAVANDSCLTSLEVMKWKNCLGSKVYSLNCMRFSVESYIIQDE